MKNSFIKLSVIFTIAISFLANPISINSASNDAEEYYLKKTEPTSEVELIKNQMKIQQTSTINTKSDRAIIGGDERTLLKSPNESIVYIRLKYEGIDGVANASGFYIGDNKIVTAGHALLSGTKKLEWASVYYAYTHLIASTMNVYTRQINVQSAYFAKEYGDLTTKKYDYGVLVLEETPMLHFGNTVPGFPMPSREMRHMTLADPNVNFQGKELHVTGYPDTRTRPIVQHDAKNVMNQDGNRLYYDIDTEPGQSGSPVYYFDDKINGYVVAGIHVDGPISFSPFPNLNSAVKIRQEVHDFMYRPIPDKRFPEYVHKDPHKSIVQIKFQYEDGSSQFGSGFFLNSKGDIMTVAHLFTNDKGSKCKSVTYAYEIENGTSPNSITSTSFEIYPNYNTAKSDQNDFAVIKSGNGKDNGFLKFWPRESGTVNEAGLRTIGYPTDKSDLWSIDSNILTTQANTFKYLGTGNMDGAPIFVFDTAFTKVVGMQIKTEKRLNNTALLINKRVIDWLKSRGYTVGHDEL